MTERWFELVQRRSQEVPIIKKNCMIFSLVKRRRGRPKETLKEIIKGDFRVDLVVLVVLLLPILFATRELFLTFPPSCLIAENTDRDVTA